LGFLFALWNKWLGDQWSIGNWEGMQAAAHDELPAWIAMIAPKSDGPPQSLLEYDPEWGRAFWTGTVAASCDHAQMLSAVKVPILLTHHMRHVDENTGHVMGAYSDLQAAKAQELITAAGQPVDYRSFPTSLHFLHASEPDVFANAVIDWWGSLGR
jgi:pimeloyl-ACP methyl ester carboxylesterase